MNRLLVTAKYYFGPLTRYTHYIRLSETKSSYNSHTKDESKNIVAKEFLMSLFVYA